MKELTALILAAGEGKRMKSKKSKLVHAIYGKAMVKWVLDSVKDAGIEEVVLITGQKAEQVEECVGKGVKYVRQQEQLGTAHAVMQAKNYFKNFKGNVVILCGDTPLIEAETIKSAIKFHVDGEYTATVITAEIEKPDGYGRVIRNSEGNVERIVEHRDASVLERTAKEINSGMYIFRSTELFEALEGINNSNDQGEYYLPDAIAILVRKGFSVGAYRMDDSSQVTGVNDREQLFQASQMIRQRIMRSHMLSGVTIIDPQSTYIDTGVKIGTDTVVYPGTVLEGATSIGEDCMIGPDSHLVNTSVGNEVCIENSVINDSNIRSKSQIGPFAYIRQDSFVINNSK